MCGIIGCKGKNIVGLAIESLSKLEYRGYDSCGIAIKNDNNISVAKAIGYVENIDKMCSGVKGDMAIAHTRWATHGGVTIENCHPHISENGDYYVVHNGIIENYKTLKTTYLKDVKFVSDTDSEVIPNMVEKFVLSGDSVLDAFKKTIDKLIGSYAIVMINKVDNCMYFARNESPLVIGVGEDNIMLSSDVGVYDNTYKIYVLDNNMYGVIGNGISVFDKNNTLIDINYQNTNSLLHIHKEDKFPHYMLKEIYDIPSAIKNTYDNLMSSDVILPSRIDSIIFVACGTSYHSALMGARYIENISHIPTRCYIASEFIYDDILISSNTLAIFISQSGETADTLKALDKAKSLGLYTLSITNVNGSTITRVADSSIVMSAGVEVCVASTKAYTTQVFVCMLLGGAIASGGVNQGKFLSRYNFADGINYINLTADDINSFASMNMDSISALVDDIVDDLVYVETLHLIGKGADYVSAMEGALKIKEISYTFTDVYPCGELKHGTLSLIDDDSFVIAFATNKDTVDKVNNAISEISSRGGRVIVVTPFDSVLFPLAYKVAKVPYICDTLSSIMEIIPIDLLAYKITVARKLNPDKPRNLAKSVTVE